MLVFFAAFFPVVGSFAVGMVAALVALVSGGLLDGLLVVVLVSSSTSSPGTCCCPTSSARRSRVHPALILVAVIVGGLLAGIPGAFLAVPVAAVLIRVTKEMHERYRVRTARCWSGVRGTRPRSGQPPISSSEDDDAGGRCGYS